MNLISFLTFLIKFITRWNRSVPDSLIVAQCRTSKLCCHLREQKLIYPHHCCLLHKWAVFQNSEFGVICDQLGFASLHGIIQTLLSHWLIQGECAPSLLQIHSTEHTHTHGSVAQSNSTPVFYCCPLSRICVQLGVLCFCFAQRQHSRHINKVFMYSCVIEAASGVVSAGGFKLQAVKVF